MQACLNDTHTLDLKFNDCLMYHTILTFVVYNLQKIQADNFNGAYSTFLYRSLQKKQLLNALQT